MGHTWRMAHKQDLWTIFERHVERTDGCWKWHGSLCKGYGHCGGMKAGQRHIRAHRLSWILHYGPIPEGMCVLHRCDVKSCTNPQHLFLGSHRDNVADKVKKGRQANGEKCRTTRLCASDVKRVFELRKDGATQWGIAHQFGVTQSCIYRILAGHSWKHLSKATVASDARSKTLV